MDVGEFSGRSLYNGLRLDYRSRLWTPTSASRAISAVAELPVILTQERSKSSVEKNKLRLRNL